MSCRHRELFPDVFLQGPNMETDLLAIHVSNRKLIPSKKILEGTIPLLYLPMLGNVFPTHLWASQETLVTCLPFISFSICNFATFNFQSIWVEGRLYSKDTVDGSQKKCTQEWTKPGKWWDKLSTSTELNRMNHQQWLWIQEPPRSLVLVESTRDQGRSSEKKGQKTPTPMNATSSFIQKKQQTKRK